MGLSVFIAVITVGVIIITGIMVWENKQKSSQPEGSFNTEHSES